MIGLFLVIIGVAIYCFTPIIVNASFNISSEQDFTSNALVTKQLLASILTYGSYILMGLGGIFSIIVGEVNAGYAVYDAIKLKNFDKENFYYDYSGLAIVSAFLLPFVFLNYLSLQVNREIKYFKRDNPEEFMLNLVSEEEFNSYDATAKTQYLSYLLENGIIDEDEFDFLIKEEGLYKESDKGRDYKNSVEQMMYSSYDETDEEIEKLKNKKNKKGNNPIYYELEEELPPTPRQSAKFDLDDNGSLREELNQNSTTLDDEEVYIRKLKEETT